MTVERAIPKRAICFVRYVPSLLIRRAARRWCTVDAVCLMSCTRAGPNDFLFRPGKIAVREPGQTADRYMRPPLTGLHTYLPSTKREYAEATELGLRALRRTWRLGVCPLPLSRPQSAPGQNWRRGSGTHSVPRTATK